MRTLHVGLDKGLDVIEVFDPAPARVALDWRVETCRPVPRQAQATLKPLP